MKLLSILSVLILTSCGILDIAEETRDKVQSTNEKMDTTNEKLDKVNAALAQTNKGVADAKAELLTTNATLEALHKDSGLEGAYNKFMAIKADDPRQLAFDLGGPAERFIESSSDERILRLFFKFVEGARQVENLMTGKDYDPGERFVKFMSAGSIAAYLPQERFEQLIKSQVDGQDIYEGVVYRMAILRFTYTRDFLIGYKMRDAMEVNLANLKDSARFLGSMLKITQLPFQDRLVALSFPKLDNMPTFDTDRVESIEPVDLKAKAAEVLGKYNESHPRLQSAEAKAVLGQLQALAN